MTSAKAIKIWITNFEEAGSALKKKLVRQKTIHTPDNVAAVRAALIKSPKCSARKHALSLNLSSRSLRRILHSDLNFHQYKVQVVQELKTADHYYSRINFC